VAPLTLPIFLPPMKPKMHEQRSRWRRYPAISGMPGDWKRNKCKVDVRAWMWNSPPCDALFPMDNDTTYDEPSSVAAEDGNVVLDGPDGVDVKLTPEAAIETPTECLQRPRELMVKECARRRGRTTWLSPNPNHPEPLACLLRVPESGKLHREACPPRPASGAGRT